jgi:hypothetical protein
MATNTTPDEGRGSAFGEMLRVRVELWLVVVFMALAFGAGIVVTALYDEPAAPVVGISNTGGQIAPPLTDQQIAGGLPSGHPDLGTPTGATGATGAGRNGESAQSNDGDGK